MGHHLLHLHPNWPADPVEVKLTGFIHRSAHPEPKDL